ncbi:inositol-1-monophosphatase [Halobacteriovorax marinus SJ]|uniref:Inositol-1-monophosphatase n=2 Tax=Halobacteriovorax marinus TaxID=97084 RepID=E1X548_HALMS|nr:inositol-1-monophosphatase [Halobacteriovorax marinus SJ]
METSTMIKNNKKNINDALLFSLDLAKSAGKILLKYQTKLSSLEITSKQAQGVASTADLASEKFIIKEISKRFPEHDILAEESAYVQFGDAKEAYQVFKEREWTWVIDPLDGTNNFLNGLDYYAICISLLHMGKPVLGVVYRPSNGDCYYATSYAESRFINYQKSQKSKKLYSNVNRKKLKEAMLSTGFVTEKGKCFNTEFDQFVQIMKKSRGIRRMGSAALDLCLVASGVFDGFWESGLAPWDMAAAGLICEQSGVKVTDFQGRAFQPFTASILAARSPFYKELKAQFPR